MKKIQLLAITFISLFFVTGMLFSGIKALAEDKSDEPTETTQTKAKETNSTDSEEALQNNIIKALPAFDWRLLDNDGLDLSTFTRVSVNTPAKLTGGVFSSPHTNREYYMFFGHVSKGETYNQVTRQFNGGGNVFAPLGEGGFLPILSPGLIGVKKGTTGNQQLFGYDFYYANTIRSNASASAFDIGELNGAGQIEVAGQSDPLSREVRGAHYIMEQYVKDNEIVAYGYFKQDSTSATTSNPKYLPVRVHGHVVDFKKGRIRYDVSFYNDGFLQKSYALTHASHMDVGGNHLSSKLFSYGTGGIYLDESTKTLADGIPARIYFYTNIGYDENSNYPTDIKTGNLSTSTRSTDLIGYWRNISSPGWTQVIKGPIDPYEMWDTPLPIYTQYNLTHPIFALRWPAIPVAAKGVGMGSLDMSIEEPAKLKPTAQKTYKNLTSKNGDNLIGDVLSFELNASNEGDLSTWGQVTLEDQLPAELELDTNSLALVDVNGVESKLDASIYNEATHTFSIGKYDLAPKKGIKLKYQAKIIGGAHKEITNIFKTYNDLDENDEHQVVIPVKGEPAKPTAEKKYTNDTSKDGNYLNDILSFELIASNTGGSIWEEVTWSDIYPAELEVDKDSFVLVDQEGIEKSITPIFTDTKHSFSIIMTPLDVLPGKQIKVKYKAKIIDGENTTVTNTFEAYNISAQKASSQVDIPILPEKPLTRDLTIEFVDKTGKKLHEPITLTKEIGETINLKELAETVGSDVYNTIEKIKASQYELVESPLDQVTIVDGENVVKYIFDGQLLLQSAPETINFDIHKYNGKVTRVNNPVYDQDLVVKDSRLAKKQWTLTAKLTDEMRNTDPASSNVVLKNAIHYVSGGKEVVLDKTAKLIKSHTNETDQDLYNISSTWTGTEVGDGLKLEVDPGDVKSLGRYQGEILWELAATPVS